MKSPANQSDRAVRSTISVSFGLLLCLLALPCAAQQAPAIEQAPAVQQTPIEQTPIEQTPIEQTPIEQAPIEQAPIKQTPAKPPFDLFGDAIENLRIYMYLEKKATLQKQQQTPDAATVLHHQLQTAQTSSDISLDSLTHQPPATPDDIYPHMVKSTLFLGQFYDCGKCDRAHLSMSGGVVIDESGLVLTNYHVLKIRDQGTTEGFMAMTYDGKCFEVEKVLAADKAADIALVQLKANGHKFHAAPIAKTRPTPTTDVRIVSHPSGEFFLMTSGEVSRYSRSLIGKSRSKRPNPTWLEVTAEFGGGSSGCGVFNSAGEVVGVVSRIKPIKRSASKTTRNGKEITLPSYIEMIVRRCVALNAIKACFAQPETDSESSHMNANKAEPKKTNE